MHKFTQGRTCIHQTTDFYACHTHTHFTVTSQIHKNTLARYVATCIFDARAPWLHFIIKHVSHERTYLHPESLIITHIHKRQTHQQTNYIKRIPTGYIFALLVKIYSIVYDGPSEFIGSSNEFLVLKIYFLPFSMI